MKAADLIGAEQRMRKSMWGQFWSAHQRFFKYLCIASKVKHAVQLAKDAVKIGKVSLGTYRLSPCLYTLLQKSSDSIGYNDITG